MITCHENYLSSKLPLYIYLMVHWVVWKSLARVCVTPYVTFIFSLPKKYQSFPWDSRSNLIRPLRVERYGDHQLLFPKQLLIIYRKIPVIWAPRLNSLFDILISCRDIHLWYNYAAQISRKKFGHCTKRIAQSKARNKKLFSSSWVQKLVFRLCRRKTPWYYGGKGTAYSQSQFQVQ